MSRLYSRLFFDIVQTSFVLDATTEVLSMLKTSESQSNQGLAEVQEAVAQFARLRGWRYSIIEPRDGVVKVVFCEQVTRVRRHSKQKVTEWPVRAEVELWLSRGKEETLRLLQDRYRTRAVR